MTDEQIKQNAEEYAKKYEKVLNYYHDEPETDFEDKKNAYIAGAHSMLQKSKNLRDVLKNWRKENKMNAFLDFLRFIFLSLFTIVVVITIACWIVASMETLHYTKQNNVLLKELFIEKGMNVDSILNNTTVNDTLNINIKMVE